MNFNLANAVLFAHLSKLAYETFEVNRTSLEVPLKSLGFSLIQVFNNPATNTQGYLATNGEYSVLCFRGTEQNHLDILTDLKARLLAGEDAGEHTGFFSAFESVAAEIEMALEKVRGRPLYATGHSLGGALAKAAILEISSPDWAACYTYGSPAICVNERAKDNKIPVFLIVNAGDIVPRILSLSPILAALALVLLKLLRPIIKIFKSEPRHWDQWIQDMTLLLPDLGKYQHFGTIHFIDNKRTLRVLEKTPDSLKTFSESLSPNWKKCFEDHSIALYIQSLEYIRGDIQQDPAAPTLATLVAQTQLVEDSPKVEI